MSIFINKVEFQSEDEELNLIRSQSIEFNEWIKTGEISVTRFARPKYYSNQWSYLTIGGYKKRLALVDNSKKNEYAKACFQLKVHDKDFNKFPLPGVIDLIPVKATTYFSSTETRKVEKLNSSHVFWSLIGYDESQKCELDNFGKKG